jgi:molybdopterin/thiamine biosynthesis adenylyltransferase
LEYLATENWHPDRLQARGRLNKSLLNSPIALIGCGALGSIMAEPLARGGINDLFLIDHDKLSAGNLVRHTLSGREIGKNKAEALSQRLATSAPSASIPSYPKLLPNVRADLEAILEDRNVIIDCTGSEEVLHSLSLGWWSLSRFFITVSVGYKAHRTFIFAHQGHSFPHEEFVKQISPMLQKEQEYWSENGETLEGAGCWSPLFPARLDDLMLSATVGVKTLEKFVAESVIDSKLVVFEQVTEPNFKGLRRII